KSPIGAQRLYFCSSAVIASKDQSLPCEQKNLCQTRRNGENLRNESSRQHRWLKKPFHFRHIVLYLFLSWPGFFHDKKDSQIYRSSLRQRRHIQKNLLPGQPSPSAGTLRRKNF